MSKKLTRKTKKALRLTIEIGAVVIIALMVWLIIFAVGKLREDRVQKKLVDPNVPKFVQQEILDEDCNSRINVPLDTVNDIVVHYVANPGSTAMQNRDYFANDDTVVNAHFVVGLEGEVIQCLPLGEQSVSSNWRNNDIIAIEVCHPDESGEFNQETYDSLVKLTAWLCTEFELDEDNIIRHYDINGKMCPLYYVENEDEWEAFKTDVKDAM